MHAYANALIAWVQEARSTTLIPLQMFYRKAVASKQSQPGVQKTRSDMEVLACVDKRVHDLQSDLDAVRARWEGCDRVREQLNHSWRTHRTRAEYERQVRSVISGGPEKDAIERVSRDFHQRTDKNLLTK